MSIKQSETQSALSGKSILDKSKFNRKFLLGLFASPYSLVPFLVGWTDLLALWAFGLKSPPAAVAGVALILGSLGIFLTRLALGKQTIGKKVVEEMEKEAEAERERVLNELDRKLAADGVQRTEGSLRDLRALAKAFKNGRQWSDTVETGSVLEILGGVEQLFRHSVLSLEKTLELWYTARSMSTEEARRPIMKQRELIIADVGKSITHLGSILAHIQSLGVGGDTEQSQLANVRNELDQSLEVAKAVSKRMRSLDKELAGDYGDLGKVE